MPMVDRTVVMLLLTASVPTALWSTGKRTMQLGDTSCIN